MKSSKKTYSKTHHNGKRPPRPQRGNKSSSETKEDNSNGHPPLGDYRGLTHPSGAGGLLGHLPNFLIVGAQKCGTTSLHNVLSQHPEVSMSQVKEINFFTLDYKFRRGKDYYSSYFTKNQQTKAIGESSPSYLCYPNVHRKILSTLGQIKIVIILRDPIKRAYSQYWDNRRQLKETSSETEIIDKYLEAEYSPHRKGYFSRGVYYPDVRKYIDTFGNQNVKVIILEDLLKSQTPQLRSLYAFLEIDEDKGLQLLPEPSNNATIWRNPLYQYFFYNPQKWKLPLKYSKLLYVGKKKTFSYNMPQNKHLHKLKLFYKPWNSKLESLLNIDLRDWYSCF